MEPTEPSELNAIAKHVIQQLLLRHEPTGIESRVVSAGVCAGFKKDRFTLLTARRCKALALAVKDLLLKDQSLVEVNGPTKVFGDVHGQLPELLAVFRTFGSPNHYNGDINLTTYVFNGDYVDRGFYSLEVVSLLFSLKVMYPDNIVLLRGNHELRSQNGQSTSSQCFLDECRQRFSNAAFGEAVWESFNEAFECLPLGALLEKLVLVVHGGIGASLQTLDDIRSIQRPVREAETNILLDILWSDPEVNDRVVGLHASRRGAGIWKFDADRVRNFCVQNKLEMIIRSHECVLDGYMFFAQGHMITIFTAGNYMGHYKNDAAMLELTLDKSSQFLRCLPKVIKSKCLEEMVLKWQTSG